MRTLAILALLVSAACTGQTTERIAVTPEANSCQVTEVRPTTLSTLTLGICWDDQGRPIGMAGAGGTAAASVPLAVMGMGAAVGSAAILGSAVSGMTLGVDLGRQGR